MDEPENLTLVLLREMRAENQERHENILAELAQMRKQTDLIPEIAAEVARLGVQAEDIKAEVLRCRGDIAGADLASRQIAAKIASLEKRVKALEEA